MYSSKTKVAKTDNVSVLELRLDIYMILLLFYKQPVLYIQAITITERIQRVKKESEQKYIINHLNLLPRRYHTY